MMSRILRYTRSATRELLTLKNCEELEGWLDEFFCARRGILYVPTFGIRHAAVGILNMAAPPSWFSRHGIVLRVRAAERGSVWLETMGPPEARWRGDATGIGHPIELFPDHFKAQLFLSLSYKPTTFFERYRYEMTDWNNDPVVWYARAFSGLQLWDQFPPFANRILSRGLLGDAVDEGVDNGITFSIHLPTSHGVIVAVLVLCASAVNYVEICAHADGRWAISTLANYLLRQQLGVLRHPAATHYAMINAGGYAHAVYDARGNIYDLK